MGKHKFFRNVVITTVAVGTAMHFANEFIIKNSTSKNLLKKDEGNNYSFTYGNIFYKVSGEGKPVLLIHDLNECSSGMEWFYLEKKLSKTYKVYTIDLLGCGRSDKPKFNYNSFLYVQLITNFIRDIIGEPTNIIATGKSAAPVIMAAKSCKIPSLIHEQNVFPGLTVKGSSKYVKHIAVSFEETINHLDKNKCILTGNPVRNEFYSRNHE